MTEFTFERLNDKLSDDHNGSYKRWLIGKLRNYKLSIDESTHQFLEPKEYDRIESLGRALDTALKVISNYTPPNNRKSIEEKKPACNSIFDY